jgi:hypothetical protein
VSTPLHHKSPVFEQTYSRYLAEIATLDLAARASVLGATADGDGLIFDLYDTSYRVSGTAIVTADGVPASDTARIIVAQYVLQCPPAVPVEDHGWVPYRSFRNAAPLVSYVQTNGIERIAQRFANHAGLLARRSAAYGAQLVENPAFDVSAVFTALPRIRTMLNFNERDEDLPAACTILFNGSTRLFLDMECVAVLATMLAAMLLADGGRHAPPGD